MLPKRDAANEDAIAYKINATASSRATIPRTVVVKGPRVLFSFNTSVVAAGAVADDIEPNTNPRESASLIFFVTKNVTTVTTIETTTNGTIDSNKRIPVNCLPYFFITEVLSSAPIKKPIKESATLLTGFRAAIILELNI